MDKEQFLRFCYKWSEKTGTSLLVCTCDEKGTTVQLNGPWSIPWAFSVFSATVQTFKELFSNLTNGKETMQ